MPERAEEDPVARVLAPLWRGLVGYRTLAWCYAAVVGALGIDEHRRPLLGVAVLSAAGAWTVVTSLGYLRGRAAAVTWWAVADLALTSAAVGATVLVETPQRIAAGAPVLTSVWSAGPPIALALALGPVAGLAGALLVQGAVLAVRGGMGPAEATDLMLLVATALTVGYAGVVLRRSAEETRRAIELRAALAERERLARSIHDGVLQVLAQVHRRGRSAGGEAAELGELAAEQEVALRALVAAGPPEPLPAGEVDLAIALAGLADVRVTVSVPGTVVALPRHTVEEVRDAVRAALDNVTRHVGTDAPAWVLLEDLGDRVVVGVRDDGPGIPAGRLAEASAEGRLGVAASIRGRIEALGRSAVCDSGPGLGTEWTFELPVVGRR